MAKEVQYDNNGNPIKKEFKVTIAGFTFGKKQILIFLLLAAIVGIMCLKSSVDTKKEEEAAREEAEAAKAEMEALLANSGTTTVSVNVHEQIQATLRQTYGTPPDGFEWSYTGELVALGDDEDSTCEDVVYMYVRALSILDFATAEKYASNSTVKSTYQSYYSDTSNIITNYYANFLRKQYKQSLTTLEVEDIGDVAVFGDGTYYVTLNIACLDLTDKDFWLDDKDSLFQTLRVYKETESDSTKVNQYVYDYIYDRYLDGTIGKRDVTVELVVSKLNGGGWLISGDGELNAALEYENGVDVANYILDEFSTWYMDVTLQEQIQDIKSSTTTSTTSDTTSDVTTTE